MSAEARLFLILIHIFQKHAYGLKTFGKFPYLNLKFLVFEKISDQI